MAISIKLTDYALKSIPGMSIKLPEEAVKQADGLMKIIVESKDTSDLYEKVKENPLLKEISDSGLEEGLLIKANYLRKSKLDTVRSLTFKDEIYVGMSSDYLTKDKEKVLERFLLIEPIEAVEKMVYNNLRNPKEAKERLKLGNKETSGFDEMEFWGFM
jgi:hypothetical protein